MKKTFPTGRFVFALALAERDRKLLRPDLQGPPRHGTDGGLPPPSAGKGCAVEEGPFFAVILSLVPASVRGISEIVVESIPSFLLAAIACVLVGVFLRNNYVAYPVCAAVLALARISLSILSRGDAALVVLRMRPAEIKN
jgi:hypothetical protein